MHAAGVSLYEDAYDAAGIRDDDHPPESLHALATRARIVTSDLARAVASAERLAAREAIATTPLLREIRIEPQSWIPLRLPIVIWDAMSYLQWFYRLRVGADHEYMRRAHEAADWLVDGANDRDVVAITHGAFRMLLVPALAERGYALAPGRREYHNWSIWSFSRTR